MPPSPDDVGRVALRFVDAEYPGASTVILGGSSSTGRRTATSDIDLLIIAPTPAFGRDGAEVRHDHGEARVAHREGERIDVFAYTVDGFRAWTERDFASLRPVLPYILTEGTPLRTGPEFQGLRDAAADRLGRGPRVSAHRLELRRYALTDLIDDLADATEDLTVAIIRADLLRGLAELATLRAGAWLGSGKWSARRLRTADERMAGELAAFAAEPATAAALTASRLLDELGGRVDSDFTR